jgi:uncharacterized protein YqgC (DUF456 family)
MGMSNGADLTKTQFKTAAGVLALAALSTDGWVSEYAARTEGGAWVQALSALVAKGVLVREMRPFVMPVGPYAGQTVSEPFYSAA